MKRGTLISRGKCSAAKKPPLLRHQQTFILVLVLLSFSILNNSRYFNRRIRNQRLHHTKIYIICTRLRGYTVVSCGYDKHSLAKSTGCAIYTKDKKQILCIIEFAKYMTPLNMKRQPNLC